MVAPAGVLTHGYNEDRSMAAIAAVDDRCGGNADLGRNLVAIAGVARSLTRAKDGSLPLLPAVCCIQRIHRVVLGGNVNHIVAMERCADAKGQAADVQGLRIHLTVHWVVAEQAEARGVHVGGR